MARGHFGNFELHRRAGRMSRGNRGNSDQHTAAGRLGGEARARNSKFKTVRITIRLSDNRCIPMLFGTSTRSWRDHFAEFISYEFGRARSYEDVRNRVVKAEASQEPWLVAGRLKWCEADQYQEYLDYEGVEGGSSKLLKPRRYGEFRFEPLEKRLLHNILKKAW